MSTISGWDNVTLSNTTYYVVAIVFTFIWLVYSSICVLSYRLKRAPHNCLAVLFCIDAESEKLFAAAKSKLVNNFNASLAQNSSINFMALCESKERLSKYNLRQDSDCLRLLEKTHAVILVEVQYKADYIDNPEYFTLKINYGVRHPKFSRAAKDTLVHDIDQLGTPLRDRRFKKKETLDVFEFSTQALVFVCQYIIGFVLLLAGDAHNAVELLTQAKYTALNNANKGFNTNKLTQVIDDRLFASHIQVAHAYLEKFQAYHILDYIYDADEILELANSIRPDMYSYNLLKAYVLVMAYQDAAGARRCIEKCKKSNLYPGWAYSDAFLCAYCGNSPGYVISKYSKAFKESNENLVELADYVEIVLSKEPHRFTLHLALGILYGKMGNNKLAKQHLMLFLERVKITNTKDKEKVIRLIDSIECEDECDRNCINCLSLNSR